MKIFYPKSKYSLLSNSEYYLTLYSDIQLITTCIYNYSYKYNIHFQSITNKTETI